MITVIHAGGRHLFPIPLLGHAELQHVLWFLNLTVPQASPTQQAAAAATAAAAASLLLWERHGIFLVRFVVHVRP
jgi:hypothetical protein